MLAFLPAGRRLPALFWLLLLVWGCPGRVAAQVWQGATTPVALHYGSLDAREQVVAVEPVTGAAIVCGAFVGELVFGTTTLRSQGGATGISPSIYVARLTAAGQWDWAVALRGEHGFRNAPTGVVLDSVGNVYVAGFFEDTLTAGANRLVSEGHIDGFVVKLNAAGQWQWGSPAASAGYEGIRGLAWAHGRLFVAGFTYSLSPLTFGTSALAATGDGTAFLGAVAPATGQWQWAELFGDNSLFEPEALAADTTGHLYAGGIYQGTSAVELAGHPLPSTTNSDRALFVGRYDLPTRTWAWASGGATGSGSQITRMSELVTDPAGAHVVAVGVVSGLAPAFGALRLTRLQGQEDGFVATLDGGAGQWQWVRRMGGNEPSSTTADVVAGAVVSASGAVAVAGCFTNTADFDSTTLVSRGNPTGFVANLTPTGQWDGAADFGNTLSDAALTLAAAPGGVLVVSGQFVGVLTLGAQTLRSPHGPMPYVARLGPGPLPLGVPGPPARSGGVQVWPNPATTATGLRVASQGKRVELLDALGRVVRAASGKRRAVSYQLDLTGLPAGLYVVRVGEERRRVVVTE